MIQDMYNQIKENKDSGSVEVRQLLSKIRSEIKDEDKREELIDIIEDDMTLVELLSSTDAKTRKNSALLIGDLADSIYLEGLVKAYEREETLFIRSAYLTAMQEFDYRAYLPKLKERMEVLTEMEMGQENQKHLMDELHTLSDMILLLEGAKTHDFRGNHETSDLMLIINREQMDVVEAQLVEDGIVEKEQIHKMRAGLRFQTQEVGEVRKIRTYQEMLFLVKGMVTCDMDANLVADKIVSSDLLNFMKKRHKGKAPFYFRMEIKTKKDLKWKSAFAKKAAMEIERQTNRELINSTSNYEFEIRLIENASGRFNMMVKLYTMKDHRFAYRIGSVATSMKPVNAALLVELAKPYMIEDAQVLDPFCGVGTLLIERQKVIKGNTSYGIDEMAEAIEKAKINTEAAEQIIHYINKDFFEFTHEYLFDEVFTDMPFAMGNTSEDDIRVLYEKFFKRIRHYIKEEATLILYSRNTELLERLAMKYHFEVKQQFLVDEKNHGKLYILK